jgi:hypothetical protein
MTAEAECSGRIMGHVTITVTSLSRNYCKSLRSKEDMGALGRCVWSGPIDAPTD